MKITNQWRKKLKETLEDRNVSFFVDLQSPIKVPRWQKWETISGFQWHSFMSTHKESASAHGHTDDPEQPKQPWKRCNSPGGPYLQTILQSYINRNAARLAQSEHVFQKNKTKIFQNKPKYWQPSDSLTEIPKHMWGRGGGSSGPESNQIHVSHPRLYQK